MNPSAAIGMIPKLFLLAAALVLGAWRTGLAADSSHLQLLQTIPMPGVKGRFDHFAMDADGKRLFVAALGNNSLEVLDVASGKRVHTIPGLHKPTGVVY